VGTPSPEACLLDGELLGNRYRRVKGRLCVLNLFAVTQHKGMMLVDIEEGHFSHCPDLGNWY
jgi:hypothetical protein